MNRLLFRWIPTLTFAVAGIAVSCSAMAFGNDGHKTVGAIAATLLKGTPAEARIKTLLESGETLLDAAVWADCAKGESYCGFEPTPEMKAFAARNPDHHGYHYTDVPIQQAQYIADAIGTTDHDVVRIIPQAVAALRGVTTGPSNPQGFTPREGLLLLCHLVGDIHQPLHVGAVYLTKSGARVMPTKANFQRTFTQGGNFLFINGKSRVMHSHWDGDTVRALMAQHGAATPAALAKALLKSDAQPEVIDGDIAEEVISWANESLGAARDAFDGVKFSKQRSDLPGPHGKPATGWPTTLPAGYAQASALAAGQQLLMAGKRLAAILRVALETVP